VKEIVILVSMTGLMVLRWIHLLWACEGARVGRRVSSQVRNNDWPATALGFVYGFAFFVWLSRFWSTDHLTSGREVSGLCLMIIGVLFRLAGQDALRSAFSWYWAPSSSLCTSGIYKWMKHPLLFGYLLEIAALLIAAHTAPWACLILIGISAALIWIQAIGEEKRLESRFGEQWRSFARGKWA
jgi:protein-S-isoprenylcysteine O-methyltransferase Ste14